MASEHPSIFLDSHSLASQARDCRFLKDKRNAQNIHQNSIQLKEDVSSSNNENSNLEETDLLIFREIHPIAFDPHVDTVEQNNSIGLMGKRTNIYTRGSETYIEPIFISSLSGNQHVEIISFMKANIRMVNIDVYPETSFEFFYDLLKRNEHVLEGDDILIWGNLNGNENMEIHLRRFFKADYGMEILLPTSNELENMNTIFVRLENFTASVDIYDSLFGTHKCLIVRISKK